MSKTILALAIIAIPITILVTRLSTETTALLLGMVAGALFTIPAYLLLFAFHKSHIERDRPITNTPTPPPPIILITGSHTYTPSRQTWKVLEERNHP